jgi:hypothetical protein
MALILLCSGLARAATPQTVLTVNSFPPGAAVYSQDYQPDRPGDKGFQGRTPVIITWTPKLADLYLVMPGYNLEHAQVKPGQSIVSVTLHPANALSLLIHFYRYQGAISWPLTLLVLGVVVALFLRSAQRAQHLAVKLEEVTARENDLIGDYRVCSLLGQGTYCRVYRVQHVGFNDFYALKLLRKEYVDAEGCERFAREMEIGRDVVHPNIIRVYGFGEKDGAPYLVMQCLSGQTLEQIFSARKTSVPDLLGYFEQICEGLACAHSHGIVHRDLKPDNVMLGPGDIVKIVDFGIARCASRNMTASGQAMGTPAYMSPEHFKGKTDARSDLYSVGVMLFEALSGRLPFMHESMVELAVAHSEEPPPSLRKLTPGLPEELYVLVDRLLAKEPGSRYNSAAEVRDALVSIRKSMRMRPIVATRKSS